MKADSEEALLNEIVRLAEDERDFNHGATTTYDNLSLIANKARELLSRLPEPPRARTGHCEGNTHVFSYVGDGNGPLPHLDPNLRCECGAQTIEQARFTAKGWAFGPARTEAGPYLPLVEDARCLNCGHTEKSHCHHSLYKPTAPGGELRHPFIHPVDERDDITARNLGYGEK